MKPKAGKTESRVQVFTDCLKEAERAQAGDVTENASAAMIYLNVLGSGPADGKIQSKIIECLRDDPDATDVKTMKKMIQDIEAEILIKGGNNPSILRRTQSRQPNSQPREAEAVSRQTQHCQICNGSYHMASKCWHRCKKEVCAKSAWHNKLKCPHKNEKGQASGQSDKKGSASRGRSKERRRGNSNKARRVANDQEETDFEAPTSGGRTFFVRLSRCLALFFLMWAFKFVMPGTFSTYILLASVPTFRSHMIGPIADLTVLCWSTDSFSLPWLTIFLS